MTSQGMYPVVSFLMVTSGVLLLYILIAWRRTRLDARLESMDDRPGSDDEDDGGAMSTFTRRVLPKMGGTMVPTDEEGRTKLAARLMHAGLYGRQSMNIFLGAKLLLMIAPTLVGLLAAIAGLISFQEGLVFGGCMGVMGMIGPSFWLDSKKKARQMSLRRSLPDALDVLVICLEGGLSLPWALRRIATDLRNAHPMLSFEINIVQREILLGRVPGDALQQMGIRTDIEEIRSLASVITQSERFGASLVKSLRIHADMLREKRKQKAEELAQKAGTKILVPTLFFIFPAMFVVILGPAAFQIIDLLKMMSFNK